MTKANQEYRYRQKPRRGNQPSGRRRKQVAAAPPAPGHKPEYAPRQREQVREGLRILAWIIARAHLRRVADRPDLSLSPDRRAGE